MVIPHIPVTLENREPLSTSQVAEMVLAFKTMGFDILIDSCSTRSNDSRIAMYLAGFQWEKVPDSPAEIVHDPELNGSIGKINFTYSICEIGTGWESKPMKYKQRLTDLLACFPVNIFVKSGQAFISVEEMLKSLVMYGCLVKKHVSIKGDDFLEEND